MERPLVAYRGAENTGAVRDVRSVLLWTNGNRQYQSKVYSRDYAQTEATRVECDLEWRNCRTHNCGYNS